MVSIPRWTCICVCCVVVCTCLGAACSRPESPSNGPAVITIGTSVAVAASPPGPLPQLVDSHIRESLITIGQDGRPSERLATQWEFLPDGDGLKLRLRPNVQFHDGTPLTAERAAGILTEIVKAGGGLSYASVTSVRAEDDWIVIRTTQPEAFLLTEVGTSFISPRGNAFVGTGPYAVASIGSTVELKAFDKFARGRPSIEKVIFRQYPTQRSVWAAMMRGEIDAVHEVSREAVEFVEAESTVHTYSFLRPYYTALGFNVKHSVLGNPAVRRALNLAINRTALIAQAMRGKGEPAQGPIWPQHWSYTASQSSYAYNPEAAKLLLDSAGYTVGRETRPGHMPSRFSFRCVLWAGDPRFERIALVVQKQLYDVGVDMEIQPATVPEFGKRLSAGDFDAFLSEQTSGRSLSWVYTFFHSPPPGARVMLKSGYTAADNVLDRLRTAIGDEQTRAAVSDLQRVLHDDPPAVFLAWGEASRAVKNDFVVPEGGAPDVMSSLWQWHRGPGPTLSARR